MVGDNFLVRGYEDGKHFTTREKLYPTLFVNSKRKSKYKTAIKQMTVYLNSGKFKEAKEFLPKFHSQLMKVAKTGAISKKTASRKISRVTKKITNLKKK